jgi:ferrous iron transport protein B
MRLTKFFTGKKVPRIAVKKGNGISGGGHGTNVDFKIAIAGNPNVGKSTVFNALTGMNQHTGNWPGKTVGFAEGRCSIGEKYGVVVDIPGTYSLFAHSPEEEVARDILLSDEIDGIVVVCDGTCLERNLVLALQILELGKPTIICINLLDEAQRKGIEIDLELLSEMLGVRVVGAVARKNGGINSLKDATSSLIDTKAHGLNDLFKNESSEEIKAEMQVARAEEIARRVCRTKKKDPHGNDRLLDRLFTGKKTAYPIMIALLLFVLWLTIVGANYPSELLSKSLFALGDKISIWLEGLGFSKFLHGLLIDGAYKTLAWIVSVMLPPMAIFFPLFTLLEDSGFLPRIAFNLDRPFRRCQSCGKQALTMCMGFGCNAAGVVGCRIIDSPREQMIAMLTNSLVPCNGRFPLLITIISIFFVSGHGLGFGFTSAVLLTSLIILSILATFAVSKLLSATLFRGMPSAFTLELPPYRPPQVGKVIVRSLFDRTAFVLGRAVASAIPAGIILWLMANLRVNSSTILSLCADFLDPFARILGLDGVILIAFILAFPANEIVIPIIIMAYTSCGSLVDFTSLGELRELLISNGWNTTTALCILLFSLFHWPCATTLMTIKKESGSLKWTIAAALIPTLLGIILCVFANFALKAFNIS